jgi:DNA (cytosine-5)-methyltransferase 1
MNAEKGAVKAVSLFSGCGGFDLGLRGGFTLWNWKHLQMLDVDIIFANDNNKDACLTYENNIGPIIHGDIENIFYKLPDSADLLFGGFPCQDFSIAGKRRGTETERGRLFLYMVKAIRCIRPLMFVAENVPGLLNHDKGETFKVIINEFKGSSRTGSYDVKYMILNAASYGVAQNRERVFIVGVRNDIEGLTRLLDPYISSLLLKSLRRVSVYDALHDLEDLPEDKNFNHVWSKVKRDPKRDRTLKPDNVAPTIRAEHHGNIEFHYNNKRRLSVREVARLQSFPDTFIFKGSMSSCYRQIGNAVPPVLAWHVGLLVSGFFNAYFNSPLYNEKTD